MLLATEAELASEAHRFAERVRRLLDGTVAQQAPISATTADGRALIGVISVDGRLSSAGLPLTIGGEHRLDLKVSYRCTKSAPRASLTVETSAFSLSLPGSRSPILRFDYVRDRSWAPAHIQFHAESSAVGYLRAQAGRPAETWRLHLPTGAPLFRPSLEDVIEFAIVEFGVDSQKGHEAVLTEARSHSQLLQLEAAIRDVVQEDPKRGPSVLRRAIVDAQRVTAI